MPLFIDGPDLTIPELKSFLVGEKVHEGKVPYAELVDSTAPITAWFYGFVDMLFGRSLWPRHLLGVIILFVQSAFLGMMFINRKAFSENTYIPSFLFSILAFFSFDTFALSGELLGSCFLLLALNNLFKDIESRTERSETIFNLGLFVSLASLCSFSFVMHLLSVCAIMIFYTRSSLRSFMLLILGFMMPQLIVMCLYYLYDKLPQLWEFYYLPNLSIVSERLMSTSGILMLGMIPVVYLVISVVMLNREARFSKYQSQLLQGMFFWMILSFFQVYYSNDFRPQNFIIVIPCFCFFITHFMLLIRRRKFAEINAWILMIGIVSMSYLARYDKFDSVNYSKLKVDDKKPTITSKKILVLDDDLSAYQYNKQATPFLNWNIARPIFQHADYYENVITIYQSFKTDLPQVIYDKHNVMPEFFERIPSLKKEYVLKQPGVYIRRGQVL